MEGSKLTILGARGSVPVSGKNYHVYGGATSCVLLETPYGAFIFDGGSGLLNLPQRVWKENKKIHLFLSHFHLDHLLGISMCPMMYEEDVEIIFYGEKKNKIKEALDKMMQLPLGPIGTEAFLSKVSYVGLEENYEIPDTKVKIKTLSNTHPGGSLAYRFFWDEKSVVYATDCEINKQGMKRMEEFGKDADLIVLDAQYTKEEYEKCKGFGHTCIETSVAVIVASGAKQGMLYHHAPNHTDKQLENMENNLKGKWGHISFAKEGDTVTL